jgi:hypothetical protein
VSSQQRLLVSRCKEGRLLRRSRCCRFVLQETCPILRRASYQRCFRHVARRIRRSFRKLDSIPSSDEAITSEGNVGMSSTLSPPQTLYTTTRYRAFIYPATPKSLFISGARLSLGSASREAVFSPSIEHRSHSTLSQCVEGQRASSDTGTVQTGQSAVPSSVESCTRQRATLEAGQPGCCENLPVDQFPIEAESRIL